MLRFISRIISIVPTNIIYCSAIRIVVVVMICDHAVIVKWNVHLWIVFVIFYQVNFSINNNRSCPSIMSIIQYIISNVLLVLIILIDHGYVIDLMLRLINNMRLIIL